MGQQVNFFHIKFGVGIAMLAILFGGSMGLSFGCCEDFYKKTFKDNANAVLEEKYNNDKSKADKVKKKSWIYMKRAHLHSLTMGVISIVLSLVVAGLAFPPSLQFTVSFLSGLGALGYGLFWMIAGFLAPGLGSTAIAKDTIGLLAQASALSFMIASITLFCFFGYRVFSREKPIQKTKQ